MKKLVILSSALVLMSCNNGQKQPTTQLSDSQTIKENNLQQNIQNQPMVGSDADEHGCKPSAGQTWSELKRECIQVFNEGKRLNPINNIKGEAVISAFVIFNEDKTKAEIFLPDRDKDLDDDTDDRNDDNIDSEILNRITDGVYQDDELKYNDKEGILYKHNKPIYKAE